MENMYMLEKVIGDNLDEANACELDSEEYKRAYKNAMGAIDRYIQIKKIESEDKELEQKRLLEERKLEDAKSEFEKKLILENAKIEASKEDQKINRIIRIVEVAAIPAGLFVLDCLFKRYYMKQVCNFEKDYTFTTTPGRSISGLFKFKK